MDNQPETLSPEESLQVIRTMIEKAKTTVADNSFYFLLWGWLVFIAALLQCLSAISFPGTCFVRNTNINW
jgi:hypothetical protein